MLIDFYLKRKNVKHLAEKKNVIKKDCAEFIFYVLEAALGYKILLFILLIWKNKFFNQFLCFARIKKKVIQNSNFNVVIQ